MRIVKLIAFFLVGIVVLILVVAAVMRKDYVVEREIIVEAPTEEVFDYVKLLKSQDEFSVWSRMDPNMTKTFEGQDGRIGAISAWDSDHEKVGKGEQEIIAIENGKKVEFELRFYEPFEDKGHAYFETTPEGDNKTKVKWAFDGEMPYPMNFMLLFMNMEEMMGNDLEQGLQNLKENLEK